MADLPHCPKFGSEYSYEDSGVYICPECGHEWSTDATAENTDVEPVIKDANSNVLQNGDTVTVVKDLKVKGASSMVKVGTKVKNIRLLLFLSLGIVYGNVLAATSLDQPVKCESGANLSEKKVWQMMVGTWYGDHRTDRGERSQWVVDRADDGTYAIRFRLHRTDGMVHDAMEIGLWGMSGPVYFSIFRGWVEDDKQVMANPSNSTNYDAYRVICLTPVLFEYEHFATGQRYTVKRVPEAFQLPE